MQTARTSDQQAEAYPPKEVFEFRLEGGKLFHFGPAPPGEGGVAQVLVAPDICRCAFPRHFDRRGRAQWSIRPIDATARRTFADMSRLTDVIDIRAVTRGAALVDIVGSNECPFIEVWLPMTDCHRTGLSTFEDWSRILQVAKDDLNRQALLRLTFDRLQESDMEALRLGRRLSTTDVALEVGPRAVQWTRDGD